MIALLAGLATRAGRVRRAVLAPGDRGLPILDRPGCSNPDVEELAGYSGRYGLRRPRQPNATICMPQGADRTRGAPVVRAFLLEHIRVWCRAGRQAREAAIGRARAGVVTT